VSLHLRRSSMRESVYTRAFGPVSVLSTATVGLRLPGIASGAHFANSGFMPKRGAAAYSPTI